MIKWSFPIIIRSPNVQEHWTARHNRNKIHAMVLHSRWNKEKPNITLPCKITLTRSGTRPLDSDNLAFAFKGIRDICADMIIPGLAPGQADGDSRLSWEYKQQKGKPAVMVEICSLPQTSDTCLPPLLSSASSDQLS